MKRAFFNQNSIYLMVIRKVIYIFLALMLFKINIYAQQTGSFTDPRDGKTYKTIKIDKQTWMAENMNFKTDTGSWCYDNKQSNCDQFGRLYGWYTSKIICPAGWKLPSKEEFETLLEQVGGEGPQAFNKLKSGGSSGFNALLGGSHDNTDKFYDLGTYGYFRSDTENKGFKAYGWLMSVGSKNKMALMFSDYKADGVSVRCLKDK